MKDTLDKLWDANKDRTFSLFSVAKLLKLTTGEVSQLGNLLDEMHGEQTVVHGYRVKRVGNTIYKLMKIVTTGEGSQEPGEDLNTLLPVPVGIDVEVIDAPPWAEPYGEVIDAEIIDDVKPLPPPVKNVTTGEQPQEPGEASEQTTGQDTERFSLYAGARGSDKAIDEISIDEAHRRIRTCPEWKAKTERVRNLASEGKRQKAILDRLSDDLQRIESEGKATKTTLAKTDENDSDYEMLADNLESSRLEYQRVKREIDAQVPRIDALESQRKAAKEALPAFTVSCLSHDGIRKNPRSYTHTGLVQLDIDIKNAGINASEIFLQLKQDPHVRMLYFSPSYGVKALFRVKTPRDKEEHKHAFDAMIRYMDRRYNLKADTDTQVSNLNALCFISHDPAASMKDAEPMPWSPSETPRPRETTGEPHAWVPSALNTINPSTLGYQEWLSIGMALHADNVVDGEALWDSFSQRDPSRYKGDEIAYKWRSFDGKTYGFTVGTIYHHAKAAGWEPPRRENHHPKPKRRQRRRQKRAFSASRL